MRSKGWKSGAKEQAFAKTDCVSERPESSKEETVASADRQQLAPIPGERLPVRRLVARDTRSSRVLGLEISVDTVDAFGRPSLAFAISPCRSISTSSSPARFVLDPSGPREKYEGQPL